MHTDSFIVYVKTEDIYRDVAEYVETRFDTSSYELDKPLPKGKNKKVTMKNEFHGAHYFFYLRFQDITGLSRIF